MAKPIVHLPFTADTNDVSNNRFLDVSGNGNHFTKTGTTKLSGRGLSFNGTSDYLECANSATLTNGWTSMTIAMVVNHIDLTTGQFKVPISKWDFQTQGSWAIQHNNGSVGFVVAASLTDGGSQYVASSVTLKVGVVYSLVFVYDGSKTTNQTKAKIYINGIDTTSTDAGTIPTSIISSTSTIKIGRWGGGLTRYLNANMYDLRIVNQSYTPIQVLDYHSKMMSSINKI